MAKDDRFYALTARTSRSRSRLRRISVEKQSLKLLIAVTLILLCSAIYGFYGLSQRAERRRIEIENQRLRTENERQRRELNELNNRVEAVEDTSRKLAEKSGVAAQEVVLPGSGGPEIPVEAGSFRALEEKMSTLERILQTFEALLRSRGYPPSAWPVYGKLESGFGGRRNPFGGNSYEFHSGQDIEAPSGAPVVAGGSGKVSFVGWQNGYGQLVIVEHGSDLTTRYGHLSQIDVSQGQTVRRGQLIGRVGSTGRSTGPHLHYEVRKGEEPVNPLSYLPLVE